MRWLRPIPVLLALLLALVVAHRPVTAQQNLLRNPGFEGSYNPWSGINEIQMAPEWTPWWVEDPGHNPPYFRPEYKRADGALFPNRVYEGSSAQQYFTFSASHIAGFYQHRVSGLNETFQEVKITVLSHNHVVSQRFSICLKFVWANIGIVWVRF